MFDESTPRRRPDRRPAFDGWYNAQHLFEKFEQQRTGHSPSDASERVFAAVRAGDPEAASVVEEFTSALANGVAALVLAIAPDIVVVGGGLSNAGDLIVGPLDRHLAQLCVFPPVVRTSPLGDESVALGALRTALDIVDETVFAVQDSHQTRKFPPPSG